MSRVRVAITIDREILARVDSVVAKEHIPQPEPRDSSRGKRKACAYGARPPCLGVRQARSKYEKALAGEGLGQEFESWPKY